MAKSKRAQILMEPREYERLEAIARAKGMSVGAIIRAAVREKYLTAETDRDAALEELFGMQISMEGLEDWGRVKRMMEEAHGAGLP